MGPRAALHQSLPWVLGLKGGERGETGEKCTDTTPEPPRQYHFSSLFYSKIVLRVSEGGDAFVFLPSTVEIILLFC